MAEYKTLVSSVFTDRDVVLKDLLSTLFLDIYKSIKDGVEIYDIALIEDLKGYPEELDLAKTAQRFYYKHFGIESLPKKDATFSLGSIKGFIDSPNISRQGDLKQRLSGILEKKYKFRQLDQFANLASQIVKWRNVWAHDGGFQNTSQASVLQANLALLLKTYPDDLQNKIDGFDSYEKFINDTFLGSILDLKKINEEEDIDAELSSLIQQADVSDNLEQLSENIDEKLIAFSEDSREVMKRVEQSIAGVEKVENRIDKLNISTSSILSAISSLKLSLDEAVVKAPFKSNQDTLSSRDQALVNEFYQSMQGKAKQSSEENVEQMHMSYSISSENSSEAENLHELKNTESPASGSLSAEDENIPILLSDDDIPFLRDPKEGSATLTKAELKDNLIELRQAIKTDMKSKHSDFQNWHNILMRPITEDLMVNGYDSLDLFKDSPIFSYYYNSTQMKGKLLEQSGAAKQKEDAKLFMDEQIQQFWPKIQQLVKSTSF